MKNHIYKTNYNKKLLIFICLFVLILSVFMHTQLVNANEKDTYVKSFTTIEIKEGDTLSSIAEKYAKPGEDIQLYIEEVIAMNNITDDKIHYGCYLVVPTYYQSID